MIAGVLPSRAELRGPRTERKGFRATAWRVTRRSKKWRSAASACFFAAAPPSKSSMKPAAYPGVTCLSSSSRASHQTRNRPTTRPYARRVCGFVTEAENSSAANRPPGPARSMMAGQRCVHRARQGKQPGGRTECFGERRSCYDNALYRRLTQPTPGAVIAMHARASPVACAIYGGGHFIFDRVPRLRGRLASIGISTRSTAGHGGIHIQIVV